MAENVNMDKNRYFVKYVIVNGLITGLNYGLYIGFIRIISLSYLLSNIISYLIAVALSYYINKRVVFKSNQGRESVLEFFFMKAFVGIVSTVVLWVVVDKMHMNYYAAFLVTTGILFLVSFFLSKLIFLFHDRLVVYGKLLRVKHWIKNLLVFIPGICGQSYAGRLDNLYANILVFLEFCFCASLIYIINDIADIEADKLNPRKKDSPLVSGAVSIRKAKSVVCYMGILMAAAAAVIAVSVSGNKFIISQLLILIYLGLNVAYSKAHLKDIPVIELIIVVAGYVLRLEVGGLLIQTYISRYLLLTVSTFCLYMILCKRFYELKAASGRNVRKVLKKYSLDWLSSAKTLFGGLGIVFYSFWAMEMFDMILTAYLILGIVILFLLYSYDAEKRCEGDPISILYSDKLLMILGFFYLLLMAVIQIYRRY